MPTSAGDHRREGIALTNLGNAYYGLGNPTQAIALHQKSLAIKRETKDRRGECIAHLELGNKFLCSRKSAENALRHEEEALTIAQRNWRFANGGSSTRQSGPRPLCQSAIFAELSRAPAPFSHCQ